MDDVKPFLLANATTTALALVPITLVGGPVRIAPSSTAARRMYFGVRGLTSSISPLGVESEERIEGVDFVALTEADVAMLRHALSTQVEEIDFSAFYLDE